MLFYFWMNQVSVQLATHNISGRIDITENEILSEMKGVYRKVHSSRQRKSKLCLTWSFPSFPTSYSWVLYRKSSQLKMKFKLTQTSVHGDKARCLISDYTTTALPSHHNTNLVHECTVRGQFFLCEDLVVIILWIELYTNITDFTISFQKQSLIPFWIVLSMHI